MDRTLGTGPDFATGPESHPGPAIPNESVRTLESGPDRLRPDVSRPGLESVRTARLEPREVSGPDLPRTLAPSRCVPSRLCTKTVQWQSARLGRESGGAERQAVVGFAKRIHPDFTTNDAAVRGRVSTSL